MLVSRSACAVALLVATACSAAGAHPAKPMVVTALYPVEEIARGLGGDAIEVVNITPPGAEPHDIELRPSDIRRIRRASLVLYLGDGFQPALESAVRGVRDRSRVVDLLDGLELRPGGEGAADPHVWLSPPLMIRMVERVARELMRVVPTQARAIGVRQTRLIAQLSSLDGAYLRGLSRCERREIFTSHAAFAYLAARYSLRQIAVTGVSPEAEPSPRRLRDVARLAREDHATTVFFESLVSPRVARAVARTIGARTAVLDPIEGLTAAQRTAGANYFSLMRDNLRALRAGLGCAA